MALSACMACVGGSPVHREPEVIPLSVEQPLAFRDADDQLVVLDRTGRLYLIDFVAVGCKPCELELPELEQLENDFAPSGRFQLVTVVYAWSGKALSTLGPSLNSGVLPLYADTEGWARKLDVTGWPTKFLVRDGRVLLRTTGGGPGAYAKWRAIIEKELTVPVEARDRRRWGEDLGACVLAYGRLRGARGTVAGRVVAGDDGPLTVSAPKEESRWTRSE